MNDAFRLGGLQAWLIALLALAGTSAGWADTYPNRPIRIIVPTQAGAAQDILARLLQPYLEKSLGQPVIVVVAARDPAADRNRHGAGARHRRARARSEISGFADRRRIPGSHGFEAVQWLDLLTTAGTPNEIVAKINAEVNRVLREPDMAAKLALQGTTAAGGTPEAFKTLIAGEIRNWKEVAQKAGIKAVD